jgi:hypothetical protein
MHTAWLMTLMQLRMLQPWGSKEKTGESTVLATF